MVWKDRNDVVVPRAAVWSSTPAPGINLLDMVLFDADGNLWRVEPHGGGVNNFGEIRGELRYAQADCQGESAYRVGDLGLPRVTFAWIGANFAYLTVDSLTPGNFDFLSTMLPGGCTNFFSGTLTDAVTKTQLDAQPSLALPDLSAFSPPFHPAFVAP